MSPPPTVQSVLKQADAGTRTPDPLLTMMRMEALLGS